VQESEKEEIPTNSTGFSWVFARLFLVFQDDNPTFWGMGWRGGPPSPKECNQIATVLGLPDTIPQVQHLDPEKQNVLPCKLLDFTDFSEFAMGKSSISRWFTYN
jgi:hypothetical protein